MNSTIITTGRFNRIQPSVFPNDRAEGWKKGNKSLREIHNSKLLLLEEVLGRDMIREL